MCGCYGDVHVIVQVGSSRLLGIIGQRWAVNVPSDTCDPTLLLFLAFYHADLTQSGGG
jgi:hypothetical protein